VTIDFVLFTNLSLESHSATHLAVHGSTVHASTVHGDHRLRPDSIVYPDLTGNRQLGDDPFSVEVPVFMELPGRILNLLF